MRIAERQTIALSTLSPSFATGKMAVGALTSTITVRLRRPTTLIPLAWDSSATVRVTITELVDGQPYVSTSLFTGGRRVGRDAAEIPAAVKTVRVLLQARPERKAIFTQDGHDVLELTRPGEMATTEHVVIVTIDLVRGAAATLDLLEITTLEEAAPIIRYHRSVAFDSKVDAQDVSGDGIISVTSDPVSGSDLAVFAGGGNSSGSGGSLGATTYNAVAMTEQWDAVFGTVYAHAGYTLAIGSDNAARTVTNTLAGSPDEHAFGVVVFSGVNQTTPVGTPEFGTGTSATASRTVNAFPGDWVVDNLYIQDLTVTIGADQTLQNTEDIAGALAFRQSTQDGATGGVMSWSGLVGDWGYGAIAFKPVVSAALTGTATASITEADIVAGGKTIIVTLTDDTYVAESAPQDISFVNNALGGTTTTTTFSITIPTTQANDLLILEFAHRGTGDGTIGGTYSGPAFTLKKSQLFGGSAFSGKTYWSRATGNHNTQTIDGSGLTNSCAAILTIYRGAATSGDPLDDATIVGEENASGNETQAEITTATNKAWVVLVVVNSPDLSVSTQACTSPGVLTERAERLSTGGTDASISHASEAKATAGATGAFTWAQTDAASGSWAYAIRPVVSTPFADARADFIQGFDSAQAEATGWNAEVRDKAAVTEVVRTSDSVATWTIGAQAGYNITAQETITGNIPATILSRGVAIVATPTFTVDSGAGPVFMPKPMKSVQQAVARAAYW